VKRYQDTIRQQADELQRWNEELEARVREQVAELERLGRLRRFLAPQVADLLMAADERVLDSHRREIVVAFCDLRGFTSFAETNEPEEVMAVLHDYHRVLGRHIHEHEGTLERFTGDGVMVFFGDPVPRDDAVERALRMAHAVRLEVRGLAESWFRRGHELALGVGVAQGYATLGRIGFEGRYDYAAIGSVTNLAARLCAEAQPWQVLVTQRVASSAEGMVVAEPVGELRLRGFSRLVRAYDVTALKEEMAR
jgi:class 3 adenylate cyclase